MKKSIDGLQTGMSRENDVKLTNEKHTYGQYEFSIIIPAYNVEKYIEACLQSILNQSFTDYEILLINDGSSDKTLEIAEAYGKKDSRIKVFSKGNAGLSHTRNYGIERAAGRYIYFVDSDDMLEENALKNIEAVIEKKPDADVIATRYRILDEKTGELKEVNSFPALILSGSSRMTIAEQYAACFLYDDISTMSPLYVTKRSYLTDKGLRFYEGILHEDELWTPQLFLNAEGIGYCENSCYIYRVNREGAITNKFSTKHYRDRIFVMDELCKLAEKEFSKEKASAKGRDYMERIACMYARFIQDVGDIAGDKQILNELSRRKHYLKNVLQLKYRILYYMLNTLGVKNTLKLFSLIIAKNKNMA